MAALTPVKKCNARTRKRLQTSVGRALDSDRVVLSRNLLLRFKIITVSLPNRAFSDITAPGSSQSPCRLLFPPKMPVLSPLLHVLHCCTCFDRRESAPLHGRSSGRMPSCFEPPGCP